MSFDYKTYVELLNDFIVKGEKIKSFRGPAITEIIAPLCSFLRVSKMNAFVYKSNSKSNDHSEPFIYFDNGNADESRSITAEETMIRGGVVKYSIYPACGEPDWTEEEISQIKMLEKRIFVFTERGYIIKQMSELTLQDSEMGVNALPYLMTTAGSLIHRGQIGDYGAVFFNIKRFSAINEKLGREVANKVMISFIQGLNEKLSGDECICRVGGDNFAALFLKDNLDFVKKYLSGRYVIYGDQQETINISTTAGFYLIPEGTESTSEIMDRASSACQLARNVFKRQFLFFDEGIMKRQTRIREIEDSFPSAIAHEEFKVFYQPKTLLSNYQIAGAEALCRWFRNGKIVPPGEFIPVLEGSKAICTLDFYMLAHVCRDIRRWLDEGREVVKVSVNLSRLHLGDEDLLDTIISIIDKYNVPHKYIEIELTETTTDVDFAELKKIVYGLREQNISTSVDDFGMGYSSLNLIREMPWNVLKIDKSFLPTHEENQDQSKVKMLRHIITMSQDMGLECIVEGVETAEQVKLLKDCKCYLAQGFYFDKPLPVNEFEQKLDGSNAG